METTKAPPLWHGKIYRAIGYYTGTIMVQNPKWVLDTAEAMNLAEKIIKIVEEVKRGS